MSTGIKEWFDFSTFNVKDIIPFIISYRDFSDFLNQWGMWVLNFACAGND
jgi:hypothetical protein